LKRVARAIVLSPEALSAVTGDETLGGTVRRVGRNASDEEAARRARRGSAAAAARGAGPLKASGLATNGGGGGDSGEQRRLPRRQGSAFMEPSVAGASAAAATAAGFSGGFGPTAAQPLSCFSAWPLACTRCYLAVGRRAKLVVAHRGFEVFMTGAVVAGAVLIGLETHYTTQPLTHPADDGSDASTRALQLARLQDGVVLLFGAEVGLKLLAEGKSPQRYFYSAWNRFDFAVTAVALVALFGVLGFNASLFRLFRLLQLLRTFSKIEKLRVIIESLSRAVRRRSRICAQDSRGCHAARHVSRPKMALLLLSKI
jgi:hypothetical protein